MDDNDIKEKNNKLQKLLKIETFSTQMNQNIEKHVLQQ